MIITDTTTADRVLAHLNVTPATIGAAINTLRQQITLGMTNTQVYTIPLTQAPPPEVAASALAGYVHPFNLGAALAALQTVTREVLPPDLQFYYNGAWVPMNQIQWPVIPVAVPPPAAPPPAVIPPAVAAAPAPAAPDPLEGLVAKALATTEAVVAPTTVAAAQPYAAGSQSAAMLEPATERVTHAQAVAEAQAATTAPAEAPRVASGLPDPSLLAQPTNSAGRPAKSAFEKKAEARNKIAPAPYWWPQLVALAPLVFTQTPPQAVESLDSTGVGPVQAYMALNLLLHRVLRDVDRDVTVAELRTFLTEVTDAAEGLPYADAVNQLRDHLFEKPAR